MPYRFPGQGVSRPTPGEGVCIPACTEADPLVDGYCSGRYAFYWNAFLYLVFILSSSRYTQTVSDMIASNLKLLQMLFIRIGSHPGRKTDNAFVMVI